MSVTIAIGADHRGYLHKQYIMQHISHNIHWLDVGAFDESRSDYPVFARKVVSAMQEGKAAYGVLICGSGMGMAIAANRCAKIYAGVVWNQKTALLARQDDNINILVLPSDFVSAADAVVLIDIWQHGIFKEGRHRDRLNMIDQ